MYDSPLRQALLSAKWSFSAVRMQSLAVLLATERSHELQSLHVNRIVPIPQHWRQRFVRHFNPAWVLGSVLSRDMHIPCDVHLLRRARRTRAQKRVAVSQRFENQTGAFQVRDPHVVSEEHILLVDDVLTSGATCSEAARTLLQAGARSCSVAVIARVLDSR
jgi:ComF family protein